MLAIASDLRRQLENACVAEDMEWTVRLAMECRRRAKEQQKRIGTAEFRNTQFSTP
jgi:ATP-dependent Lon protease